MTKAEAIEKVRKILALANDRAASPAEKETALNMADKLAAKYGLKVVTRETKPATQQKANPTNFYNFKPKRAYTELLEALAVILSKSGFVCFTITEGRKVVGIRYLAARDITKELEKFYKMTIKSCEKFKETIPSNSMSGRNKTMRWKLAFTDAFVYSGDNHSMANLDGNTIYNSLRRLKEELG